MLPTLGIICVLLSINMYNCEATVVGEHVISNTDLNTPFLKTNGCEMKNNTYFICCVEWKALICFEGQYLTKEVGIEVALLINNKIYWQEIISETNPPEICVFDIPDVGEICFKFYDVQIKEYHFCLNLTVKLDVIFRIPLKKIHIGCLTGKKEMPKTLKNCTVNNITETSFDLHCLPDRAHADNTFLLKLLNSDNVIVANKTASVPAFVISQLYPGKTYYAHAYATNKFGQSQPTKFNITTKQEQVLEKMTNAVVNINVLYTMLTLLVVTLIGLTVGITLKKTCSTQIPNKTYAQIKSELAYKLLPEEKEKTDSSVIYK